jgi:predicted ATP-grasp superfamily ATP-dependent carboligase
MSRDSNDESAVPVLAIGFGLTTLGAIRCLGRAGIPVYCVHRDLGFVGSSRWCRRTDKRIGSGEDLSEFLRQLPFEKAVLMPCSDDWVVATAAIDPELTVRFPASQPSRDALETLTDKGRFARALEESHVPQPRTVLLRSAADLAPYSDKDLTRYFLKPRDSIAFHRQFGVKAWSIPSRADAEDKLRTVAAVGLELVLQEYVPGPATLHYMIDGFMDRKGIIRARSARRRVRMHPPLYGNTSVMYSVPIEEAAPAMQSLERLLSALSYRGIFSAEFKLDPRDGSFKLLEINPRPWWYVEFPFRCGINVCSMAYRDALGLDVEPVLSYRTDVRCVNFSADVADAVESIRSGRLTDAATAAISWVSWPHIVFQTDDPMPALSEIVNRVVKPFRARGGTKPVQA